MKIRTDRFERDLLWRATPRGCRILGVILRTLFRRLMEEDFLLVKAAGHASSSMGVVDALNSVRADRNVGYSYLRDFFGIKVYGRLIIGISEQIYGD